MKYTKKDRDFNKLPKEINSSGITWIVDKRIGKGGNGEVWRAYDKINSTDICAIKFIKDLDISNRENITKYKRVKREIEALTILSNIEGIMPILDSNMESKLPWIRMPLAVDLKKFLLKNSNLEKLKIFVSLLDTVSKIHDLNYAHRDIKPDNIMLLNNKIILTDFGLVKPPRKSWHTPDRSKLGNFATIAPELRYTSSKIDDHRPADIYSLGVTLWMMLVNDDNGFDGEYAVYAKSTLDKALLEEKLLLNGLHEILEKVTSHRAEDRPDIHEFKDNLTHWLKEQDNYQQLINSKWVAIQKIINPTNADTIRWTEPQDIVNVLNTVVYNDERVHHFFFPNIGGLDIEKVLLGSDKNNIFIKLSQLDALIEIYPKILYFVNYSQDKTQSFFFLETNPLSFPINEPNIEDTIFYRAYTLFPNGNLASGDHAISNMWEGIELEQGCIYLERYYSGKFLIVSRFSNYNQYSDTYDGRHNKYKFEDFENYYRNNFLAYSKNVIKSKEVHYLLENKAWKNNPEHIINLKYINIEQLKHLINCFPKPTIVENEFFEYDPLDALKRANNLILRRKEFKFLDDLNIESLCELRSLMEIGKSKHGARILRKEWEQISDYFYNYKNNKSDLIMYMSGLIRGCAINYINNGLSSLGLEINE